MLHMWLRTKLLSFMKNFVLDVDCNPTFLYESLFFTTNNPAHYLKNQLNQYNRMCLPHMFPAVSHKDEKHSILAKLLA